MHRLLRFAVRACLVLIVVATASCSRDTERKVDTNFDNYPALAAGVGKTTKVVLFEGLPHQHGEQKALEEELRSKPTVQLHDYPFYADPLDLKPADATELTKLFTDANSFSPYRGPKLCGGYHPDYAIEWHTPDGVYRCLVCLGCCEVKVFGPESELHCDIATDSKKKFDAVLKPYRKNRPPYQGY